MTDIKESTGTSGGKHDAQDGTDAPGGGGDHSASQACRKVNRLPLPQNFRSLRYNYVILNCRHVRSAPSKSPSYFSHMSGLQIDS